MCRKKPTTSTSTSSFNNYGSNIILFLVDSIVIHLLNSIIVVIRMLCSARRVVLEKSHVTPQEVARISNTYRLQWGSRDTHDSLIIIRCQEQRSCAPFVCCYRNMTIFELCMLGNEGGNMFTSSRPRQVFLLVGSFYNFMPFVQRIESQESPFQMPQLHISVSTSNYESHIHYEACIKQSEQRSGGCVLNNKPRTRYDHHEARFCEQENVAHD